ncbi:hypothetical protein MMC18_002731 [Xylographa bjoerkii]|nr:hypothetical protein [Xylographa bjoerkii]
MSLNLGGGGGYEHINPTKLKFPEDHTARDAALAQQGFARIKAENAAKAEKKAAKEAAKRNPATVRGTGDGESVRELLVDDEGASAAMTGGKKRGLLGGFWKGGGKAEVVR